MAKPTTVKVYSTEKDKHHKTGESWETTPELAESMAKRGLVTLEEPKAASKKDTK